MVGQSPQPAILSYLGLLVAAIAVVGTVALGWEWGAPNQPVPTVLGIVCAIFALGWTVYSRVL